MNNGKASYYKQTEDGHSVFFDGLEVADKLTTEQAGQLLDDLSYYGTPIYCAYNRRELCVREGPVCMTCPAREQMEAETHV